DPSEEKTAAASTEAKTSESKPENKPVEPKTVETKPLPIESSPKSIDAPKVPAATAGAIPLSAWPSFRGPQGQGIAPHHNAPLTWTPETIAWKKPIAKPGTNSPIVWGDQVFLAGADEQSRD